METDNQGQLYPPEIWVIGGGKGGTGKTFVASSLGICLARNNNKVILIDNDIGGANLHSMLGIRNPEKSLTHFFEKKMPLEDIVLDTGMANLSLISGDIHSLDPNSIKHAQKMKLLRHIAKLQAQYAIIDVGAGSHHYILDTFLFADKMIVIVVPEIIAVENAYQFIKNAQFRKLRMLFRTKDTREIVLEAWSNRGKYEIKNLKDLIEYLKRIPDLQTVIEKEMSRFKVHIILNKARNSQDAYMGFSLKSTLMKYLGIKSVYAGFIEYGQEIENSVRKREPLMRSESTSSYIKEVEVITDNLVKGKEAGFF
ncbi:MAG: AAA family ATPase [Candidatus Aminicenantes bacterium]|nr:AAA family ATPase [Candidatus Aminicenantes bacterium]